MDTQLRIGNVGTSSTNVTVTIGGTAYGPYAIAPNQSIRESYAGVNNGPVTVTGSDPSVPIIATERLGWAVNGVYKSITEMLGLPSNQLTNILHLCLVQRCHHGYPTQNRSAIEI